MKENLSEMGYKWTGGRFAFRSSFYAGRPHGRHDLNSKILEMIYHCFFGPKRWRKV